MSELKSKRPPEDNDNNLLWTGESVYCICTHHIEVHETVYDLSDIILGIANYGCKRCRGFVSYRDNNNGEK